MLFEEIKIDFALAIKVRRLKTSIGKEIGRNFKEV